MSNVMHLLPILTVNRQFIGDFLVARTPSFGLGMIEERNKKFGLLTLRPNEIIPPEIMRRGFNFGHSLLGNTNAEVVHFAFEFYGFGTYNVLLNPNNSLVQAVLAAMIDSGQYFFLMIGPDQGVTSFRSKIGADNLTGLTDNLARIRDSVTNDVQYQQIVRQFQKQPSPPGQLLTWVCRNNSAYVDLSADRLELIPR